MKKKNLITVLKKLLRAFGGDDSTVRNDAVDVIDKMAVQINNNTNNDPYIITLSDGEPGTFVADKTITEISKAFYQGKKIMAYYYDSDTYISLNSALYNNETENKELIILYFQNVHFDASTGEIINFTEIKYQNNAWDITEYQKS